MFHRLYCIIYFRLCQQILARLKQNEANCITAGGHYEKKTELEKHNILRQSNKEANAVTRECIESALIKLMEKKDFADISITEIITKAGVSRVSYYRNYSSKEDILSKYIQSIVKCLSDCMLKYDAVTQTQETWLALLNGVKPYANQYKLLLKAGCAGKMLEEYTAYMNQAVPQDNYALIYSNCYWAGAITSVLSEWIRGEMSVPAEQVAEIGCDLMRNGIGTVLKYGNGCE